MVALALCNKVGARARGVTAGLGIFLFILPAVAVADDAGVNAGADEAVGTRYHITVDDLPAPYATPSASNRAVVISRPPGARLRVPEGFEVTLFAEGLQHPRAMVVADDGTVFVAEPNAGQITRLEDVDGDGLAESITAFAHGFRLPSGLAFNEGGLYVADERAVWWLGAIRGQQTAEARRPVTRPGALGNAGGHWTRMLRFSPDGQSFYVSIGSEKNLDEEVLPRASIQRFELATGEQQLVASGLRNPVGLAFHPDSGRLFSVVSERDGMGEELVPDYLTEIVTGGFYGWPYAYLGPNKDPGFGDLRPDLVEETRVPDVLFAAHSGVLGLVFYDGEQFPEDYSGDAFVALHGSWNAATPTGYKVVRVPFSNGRPLGTYETFVVGFWTEGETPARVWGRPAGLVVAGDGSLLISDDEGGTIWRVRWTGN